jgi:hypothetical protein
MSRNQFGPLGKYRVPVTRMSHLNTAMLILPKFKVCYVVKKVIKTLFTWFFLPTADETEEVVTEKRTE